MRSAIEALMIDYGTGAPVADATPVQIAALACGAVALTVCESQAVLRMVIPGQHRDEAVTQMMQALAGSVLSVGQQYVPGHAWCGEQQSGGMLRGVIHPAHVQVVRWPPADRPGTSGLRMNWHWRPTMTDQVQCTCVVEDGHALLKHVTETR